MKLIRPSIFSEIPNVIAAFTESNRELQPDGYSEKGINFALNGSPHRPSIEKNYKELLDELDLKTDSIALAKQVHGSNIQLVEKSGIYPETDGLITKIKGFSLGIQVADCAAVLIADDKNDVVGAFHAGWRGAVANIIPKGLKKMQSVGGDINNFKAYISPCISQSMFEVGEEVAIKFPEKFVDRLTYSKPHVDLKGFLRDQMEKVGMKKSFIEVSSECTMQDLRFFSYRREREKAGRMLALISLK
ncbi:peptidoglycan editing factor PgeF [Rhodohalobacter sulfatireducens]|uniref:Purine nucleoside phosphorylase n=1 Tax=Rhodohalobacter sulfatireducens TaxID=2911366 RepID=A0ABS9KG16_9BACT|nr:peptidoglycan editing factor PgeF [Rhodohalobacter sulfatireducens]MCG2589783.1 peptidoglycan editing factor PgeF [Rhodohalobacter sulfatireducens]